MDDQRSAGTAVKAPASAALVVNHDPDEDAFMTSVTTQVWEPKPLERQALISADAPMKAARDRYLQFAEAKTRILVIMCYCAFLSGMTTTIYLPLLEVIALQLSTTILGVTSTLASYTFLVGAMPLFWGPVIDRHGRKWVLVGAFGVYGASCIGCGVSTSIYTLICFRSLQAIGVSATVVIAAAVVSDVYPENERKFPMICFGMCSLLGPVLGPCAGVALNALFGDWRMVFYALAAGCVPILLAVVFMRETLVADAEQSNERRPWNPCSAFFTQMPVLCLALCQAVGFAAMYSVLLTLPFVITDIFAKEPYVLGLSYLPYGTGLICGGFAGRPLAVFGRRRYGRGGGLLAVVCGTATLCGAILGFAWALSLSIFLSLAFTFLVGLGLTMGRVGLILFCMEEHALLTPSRISTACTFLQFTLASIALLSTGAMFTSGRVVSNQFQFSLYFTGVAGVVFLAVLVELLVMMVRFRHS